MSILNFFKPYFDTNMDFYNSLCKSPLTPPSYVFGIVWPILYALIASTVIYQFYDYRNGFNTIRPTIIYIISLCINLFWSYVFFQLHYISISLYMVGIMLGLNLKSLYLYPNTDNKQIIIILNTPYNLWLLFAFYLNYYIVLYN